ncbi:MAG TPA: hypothetical protein VGR34_06485 [Candidatus Dormibacteraeota bacterium]|nr:hypothetical protein [Candidatus Dormibacteraeota bacterium]
MAPVSQQMSMILVNAPSSSAVLGNGGVYTSPWFDATQIPVNYVEVSSYSDQGSAAGGLVVQESDDTTNANFTSTAGKDTAGAATFERMICPIRKRFWRVVYTNGVMPQTAWELAVGLLGEIPAQVDNSGNVISPQQSAGWNQTSAPATGTVASAAQAAAPGLRHICTGLAFSWSSSVAPAATVLTLTVLDGAAVVWTTTIFVPAVVGGGSLVVPNLNLQGSANQAMTAAFSGGLANLNESVSMQGYDLQ